MILFPRKISAITAAILLLISTVCAQDQSSGKYWVFLTDKQKVNFDPYSYFDIKAIERRLLNNIPVNHPTDWPLNPGYINTVGQLTTVLHHSRWFNALAVKASEQQIAQIEQLHFVKNVVPMIAISYPASIITQKKKKYGVKLSLEDYELMNKQTQRHKGDLFSDKGIDGKGVRVAIFDAGFPTVDVNPSFEHIRKENRIIMTKDFLTGRENVYKHSSHGTHVLSCIAGKIGNRRMGMATGAEFLLARTESGLFEPFSEEENWLAAAEWADKNGADIISSSLGYTVHRYFTWDMDGKKSFVARAANMAASKGLLVINAAGNDGSNDWKYQGTPADADSVLSVGGISALTGYHISFSSYGPTADKRMKPNVCAYGYAVVAGKKDLEVAYGTSFSTPLVSGFAACAWQMNRNLTNMEMFTAIERAGELYPYFDYAHGFGVPQADRIFSQQNTSSAPTFKLTVMDNSLSVMIDKNKYNVETEENKKLFYYHIENNKGYLDKYYVLSVDQYDILTLDLKNLKKGNTLRFHFNGYTEFYQL